MRKILVVDDSQMIREAVSGALKNDGFDVSTASDGVEAIHSLKQSVFDAMILDIDMPRMNGFQVCRLVKNDPVLKTVPIIMLTAKTSETDELWGRRAGADEYIRKPFEYAKIREALNQLFTTPQ